MNEKLTIVVDTSDTACTTHLGFCIPFDDYVDKDSDGLTLLGHQSPFWEDWDGGQVGGHPSWLQPRDLPTSPLRCATCDNVLKFICQIYAPADQVNPDAFHRSLYVFACSICCRSSRCRRHGKTHCNDHSEQPSSSDVTKGIRILRTQLPRINPFYPLREARETQHSSSTITCDWEQHLPSTWNVHLCVVCHQRAQGKCPLQQLYFCCKEHQKLYKKYGSKMPDGNIKMSLPWVYSKWELVVEDEPPAESSPKLAAVVSSGESKTLFSNHEKEAREGIVDDINDGDHDSDADLEQEDLNAMMQMTGSEVVEGFKSVENKRNTKGTHDAVTMDFYERLSRPGARNQCIRYRQWPNLSEGNHKESTDGCHLDDNNNGEHNDEDPGVPLWIRSDFRPTSSPPLCPYCGAPRKFEFQIMPQMLHYLLQKGSQAASSSTTQMHAMDNNQDSDTQPTTSCSDEYKQVLMKACALAEEVPPDLLPANFEEQRQAAVATMQNQLMGSDSNQEVDWGTIVIYTCTASCSKKSPHDSAPASGDEECHRKDTDWDVKDNDPENDEKVDGLGAYLEEYAWWQPPLDD